MKKVLNIFSLSLGLTLLTLLFATANVWAQKKKPAVKPTPTKAAAVSSNTKTAATKAAAEQPPAEAEQPAEAIIAEPTVAVAPAKSSRAKICVAAPKTNLQPSETAPESLRNSLVKYLSGPAAEIIPLESMVAVQQQAEAAEKGCAFYLVLSVMQKKKGGGEGFGNLLKKGAGAAPLLDDIGAGKTAQTISKTAGKSAVKMTTAGDLAIGIKAKDEVTLEYSLLSAQTQASATNGKIKAKASKDGEDVLSNMLEQSVNAVLTVALKK